MHRPVAVSNALSSKVCYYQIIIEWPDRTKNCAASSGKNIAWERRMKKKNNLQKKWKKYQVREKMEVEYTRIIWFAVPVSLSLFHEMYVRQNATFRARPPPRCGQLGLALHNPIRMLVTYTFYTILIKPGFQFRK